MAHMRTVSSSANGSVLQYLESCVDRSGGDNRVSQSPVSMGIWTQAHAQPPAQLTCLIGVVRSNGVVLNQKEKQEILHCLSYLFLKNSFELSFS